MTDINKNFRVKQGLETPTISVDSTATFSKGLKSTTGLAVGGFDLNSAGRSQVIYNSTLSATAILGNYSTGTEGPVLLRAYGQNRTGGTSSTAPQATFYGEGARGTGASPLAPTSGQLIANFAAGGYDGNRWISDYETTATNNLLTSGSLFFFTAENWSNGLGTGSSTATNVGTGFAIWTQPAGIRLDTNSRQRFIQVSPSTLPTANSPAVVNMNLGNGNNSTPNLTLANGSTYHQGFGRVEMNGINSTFQVYGVTVDDAAVFTADISGTTMTVSAVSSGKLSVGQRIYSNSAGAWGSISSGTTITALMSGTGGSGTYTVSQSQTIASTTLYSGADNQTYQQGHYMGFITNRRSGASGRRNKLKSGDRLGSFYWNAQTADNSTGAGSTVASILTQMLDDASPTAYGSKMLLRTVNSGTTTISDRLELTDKNNTHYSDSHNFKNAAGSTTIATFNSSTATFYSRLNADNISSTATTNLTLSTDNQQTSDTPVLVLKHTGDERFSFEQTSGLGNVKLFSVSDASTSNPNIQCYVPIVPNGITSLGTSGTPWVDSYQTTINLGQMIAMTPLTSDPFPLGSTATGVVVMADQTTWDPANYTVAPYLAVYTGSEWRALKYH
jgi:hypothetical protein